MSSLLDQSALTDLAARLVEAARRAGADAADAVAVRSVSMSVEVREGAVEETERAEGDDMGLRVLVGKRQAVVSTNDLRGNGAAALAVKGVAKSGGASAAAGIGGMVLVTSHGFRGAYVGWRHSISATAIAG